MFKEITIENFQSFPAQTISFCDGVNAIVGLSRSGKTTILRAIRWCATNEPKGDAFQSWWGGDPSVRILFDDGVAVTRKRHKEDNFYIIEKPGQEDLVLTAFGVKVPEEVAAIFNMDGTNLQGQMDGVFFLSLQPGAVAKQLNQAVNLDIIDTATASIRTDKTNADKLLKFEKGRVKGIEEKIADFDYLDGLEAAIKSLEQTARREKSIKEQLMGISSAVASLESNSDQAGAHEKIVEAETAVLLALDEATHYLDEQEKLVSLGILLKKIDGVDGDITKASALSGASAGIEEAQSCCDAHKLARLDLDFLEKILGDIQYSGEKITKQANVIIELEEELEEIMADKCPILAALQKTECPWGERP